jgi:hypothetical protein
VALYPISVSFPASLGKMTNSISLKFALPPVSIAANHRNRARRKETGAGFRARPEAAVREERLKFPIDSVLERRVDYV